MNIAKRLSVALAALTFAVFAAIPALAQNIRGSSEGPTKAPGYDHPDQFMHLKDVAPADNMYPVIAHPQQEKQARDKLVAASLLATKPR